MRGLFFKIFVIFWIAQSLIFVISTSLILRHRFPHPDALRSTLYSNLRTESAESADAFEKGGCTALAAYAATHHQVVSLEDQNGNALCNASAELHASSSSAEISGIQKGAQYIWTVPTLSLTGKRYIFHLQVPHHSEEHTWYQDLLHFASPQLPVAIAVGGATTFVLVLLFTRPLVRLRKAARELANGNLAARVQMQEVSGRVRKGDEFHALMHDFNHMAGRLESLVHAQQLLLRDVSHELRSPLARLSVALELARDDAAPEMTTHLDRIEREAGRLNQLIGQLLTLSSMEALDTASNFQLISLCQLLEELIPDAQFEAQQRQCSVALQAPVDCTISGNRELLYRAVENIVRNAIRYTASGTEVEIALKKSGDTAAIEISDHGPGIPENEIQAVFRPFYRVDPARSSATGGFGVGLAIADRAAKLHCGKLEAFNRAGGGTTIRMSVPLANEC